MLSLAFNSTNNEQISHEIALYGESISPTLSFTRPQELQTQISSVDFATLSKQSTNSSHGSSLRTGASHKRSLTRLFSRRKTSLDTFQLRSKDSHHGDLDSINPKEMEKPQSMRERFKGSISPRKILNSEKKSLNKVELTNQTSSQPRSSLSKSSSNQPLNTEGFASERYQTPPIYQNSLFQRPQFSLAEQKSHVTSEQRDLYQTLRRNIVQLSSQSSNSLINDRVAASSYNFTNPVQSGSVDIPNHESKSLIELHRRYMVSADLYIQKLHKTTPEESSPSISNPSSRKEKLRIGLQIYDEHYNKAFSELYELVRPILLIQGGHFGTKSDMRIYTVLTIEEVASFVEERLLGARNIFGSIKRDEQSLTQTTKEFGRIYVTNNLLSTEDAEDEMRELESKEFLSKISLFFFKCCHTLADNFLVNKMYDPTKNNLEIISFNTEPKEIKTNHSVYLENWFMIARAWDYFNSRVRFYLLHIFLPAQLQLEIIYPKDVKYQGSISLTNLEKDLLNAFRDAFIVPQLRERMTLVLNQEFGTFLFNNPVLLEEKNIFADKRSSTSKSLTNCFGILSSYARADLLTPEDLQPDDVMVGDFMRCLKLYSR